jgi:hypothetical protein
MAQAIGIGHPMVVLKPLMVLCLGWVLVLGMLVVV